jgi:hypothetical protein
VSLHSGTHSRSGTATQIGSVIERNHLGRLREPQLDWTLLAFASVLGVGLRKLSAYLRRHEWVLVRSTPNVAIERVYCQAALR